MKLLAKKQSQKKEEKRVEEGEFSLLFLSFFIMQETEKPELRKLTVNKGKTGIEHVDLKSGTYILPADREQTIGLKIKDFLRL